MGRGYRKLGLLFVFLFTLVLPINYSFAAPGDPCPGGQGDCDRCAGEYCYSGTCYDWGIQPCNVGCEECSQSGDQITCTPSDSFCDNLAGDCRQGTCDENADPDFNPTGCQYEHDSNPQTCQSCQSCGNGICENPENANPPGDINPNGCPEDCLNPGADPSLPEDPDDSCGYLDEGGTRIGGCNDGDVCTDDVCQRIEDDGYYFTCEFNPKSCSGATADLCCPQGCSGDSQSGSNYDVDCCVPPSSPEPSPTPEPIPSASVDPGKNSDGTDGSPQLWFHGSGCQLISGAGGKVANGFGLIFLLGMVYALWKRIINFNKKS